MTTSPYRPPPPNGRLRGGLAEVVAAYLRDLILTGALKPGTKIDQDVVGARLEVSRSPIREALVVLGEEGLLDIRTHRGAYVMRLTPEDIGDHYELYGLVSGRAAAIAAMSLGSDELTELHTVHKKFVAGADLAELQSFNDEFHRILNSASPRRTRWLLGRLLRSVPTGYYEFIDGWDARAVEHHGAILRAVTERDAAAARSCMEAHLHESGMAAVAALHGRGYWSDDDV